MPTQEKFEKTALEYGELVAGIKEKTLEKNKLAEDVQLLAKKRTELNDEIARNEEANVRVRSALLEEEAKLEELRKQKADDLMNERVVVDAQRRENSKRTNELNEIADAQKKRTDDLNARDRALATQQSALDARAQKLSVDQLAMEEAKRDLESREKALALRGKALDTKDFEVSGRLRKAEIAESNAKSNIESARTEARRASDDRLKEQSNMLEAQQWTEQRQAAERQIRALLPVLDEVRIFIRNNVKNYDLIDSYIRSKFPTEAQLPKSITQPANV